MISTKNNLKVTTFIFYLVVGVSLMSGQAVFANDRPPNIVLIVSDDQGYNDLGLLDNEVKTPHLDQLAKQGVRLTSFYVAFPQCTPSRAAYLTGRYPQRNGMYDMIRNEAPDYGYQYEPEEYAVSWERIGGMDLREVLIPQYLAKAGYVSGIFGKWDLGMHRRYLPEQRGFDAFYGFVNTGIDYFTHERYGVPSMYRGNEPTQEDKGEYCTWLFQKQAERFLQDPRDEPFFLYLPFNAPHVASNLDPNIRHAAQAPEAYHDLFPDLRDALLSKEDSKQNKKAHQRLEYLASLACMDESIGKLLAKLDEYNLSDNTVIVFFSDNGGGSGSHNAPLRGGKMEMLEGGVRVCAIVRGPDIEPDRTNDEFITSLDLLPTFLRLAGLPQRDDVILDGYDIWPVLTQGQASPRSKMFWKRRHLEAARVGDWKWSRDQSKVSLYNLKEDLSERMDLTERYPDKATELQTEFENWMAEMEASEPRGPFRDF